MEYLCLICNKPVDPDGRTTMQQVVGWQRRSGVRASGKHGGSDILDRKARPFFAHGACVKLAREGLLGQQSLEFAP
jgi:hypothetical protein